MQRIIDQARPMIEYVIRQKLPDLSSATPKQKNQPAGGSSLLLPKSIPVLPWKVIFSNWLAY